jgi:hypothetical protein
VVGVFVVILTMATPIFADTALPSPDPTVIKFNVYHNLLEDNDYLLLIYANIPYADNLTPDDPVTDTFIWRLFDDTNTTELGLTVGYVSESNTEGGYNYNLYSIYCDNATAPDWGDMCYLRLCGNPSAFDSPPTYTFQLSSGDYTTMDDTDDVQIELTARILTIANDLDQRWELPTGYTLTSEAEIGTVLSIYGEAFFRGAIYGLQGLAPGLFLYTLGEITIEARDWELTYTSNLTSQWADTWVEDALESSNGFFGAGYDLLSVILVIVLAGAALIGNVMLTGDTWSGLIDASIVLILTARLGLYGLGYLGLFAALGVIYIGIKIWGLRQ